MISKKAYEEREMKVNMHDHVNGKYQGFSISKKTTCCVSQFTKL